MGELSVSGIKFGTYRLKEINAPIGYELNENPYTESVVLDSTTVGKTFELKMQNDRKTGSASMTKYSEDGKTPLAGAKYDLYMVIGEIDSEENGEKDDQPIKYSLTTDTNGTTPTVSGLEWGKYYFVEVYAPKGYKKSSQKISFEITAQDVDVRKDMTQVDTKILGSVKLTKIAGDEVSPYKVGDKLPNVEFELYTKSGTQVKASYDSQSKTYSYDPNGSVSTFITDENGMITVNNLPWDSYYFEETKALSGFSLADKVRFTINASNCTSVQEIECENQKVQCSLKVTKQIDTSVEDFGTPTFLFKITKLDENGNKTSQSYTKSLIIKSGTSNSFTMLVDPGKYLIEEIKVARYNPKSVEIVETETTTKVYSIDTDKNTATVTLATTTEGEPDTASIKFTNELYRYDKVSHNSSATNIIAANRKITGISAEYNAGKIPLNKSASESTYTFGKADVTYKILYDDGSEEEITSADSRYTNFTPDSYTVNNGINDAGQILSQEVSYTDSTTGKTYKAQFDVEVAALKVVESIKIIFKVDAENSCYFLTNNKRTTANVVYYNEDDDGNKISVSGEYITPTVIDEESYIFSGWVDADGKFIASSEERLKEYLKSTDKTELTLYARIINRSIVEDFDYTGEVQEFTAPVAGYYKLETWGAQGGGSKTYTDGNYTSSRQGFKDDMTYVEGGKGGYTTSTVYLEKGQTVYIAVGGQGNELSYNQDDPKEDSSDVIIKYGNGFNGGGIVQTSDHQGDYYFGGGGGATHIALTKQGNGLLSNYENYQGDVLTVAGGGGGSGFYHNRGSDYWQHGLGGAGGGLESQGNQDVKGGYWGYANISGSSQTSSGTLISGNSRLFRQGSFGQGATNRNGGGGGWYGGSVANNEGGAGGSGHISTATVNGKDIINGESIIGTESFKAPDGTYETGHSGNGYARISYIMMENFEYTGEIQEFTAPVKGYYKLETWGAQGGGSKTYTDGNYISNRQGFKDDMTYVEGGKGGYTTSTVYLEEGQTVYIAVGGQGEELYYTQNEIFNATTIPNGNGFNGGGKAFAADKYGDCYVGGGGGATHIALTKQGDGLLSNYESYQDDVIAVAGGGGGSGFYHNRGSGFWHHGLGGAGGGLESQGNYDNNAGNAGKSTVNGSTQTSSGTGTNKWSKGSFGQGATYYDSSITGSGSGGGGWYGGSTTLLQGGAGGSGHISTTTINGKDIINGESIIGTEEFPSPYGTTETGHTGNGYARITYVEELKTKDFGYTGDVQTFTALQGGTYKFETWGAQGGGSVASKTNTYPNNGLDDSDVIKVEGGRGGYTTADVYLNEGQTIYIIVGSKGQEVYGHIGETTFIEGGYNGGGIANYSSQHSDIYNGGGGGATHIALTQQGDGQLSNYENNKDDVLVVAGGGGGSGYYQNTNLKQFSHHGLGGAGGGLESQGNHDNNSVSHGKSIVYGSTQTSSGTGTNNWSQGSFGQGASYDTKEPYGSGGGGGWYGGSSAELQGGAGGSGHIGTGLTGETIAGTEEIPSPYGTTEIGHQGNGYARITFVK